MSHVSYTELRARLAKYMDEVCDSRAPLHITRRLAHLEQARVRFVGDGVGVDARPGFRLRRTQT